MKKFCILFLAAVLLALRPYAQASSQHSNLQVKVANGILEGVDESGVRSFKGIPYAQPPVGDLRWKEPQPAKNWKGILAADKFGPRAMQRPIYSDMNFRSNGISEDCLYLNVWTPPNLLMIVCRYSYTFMEADLMQVMDQNIGTMVKAWPGEVL